MQEEESWSTPDEPGWEGIETLDDEEVDLTVHIPHVANPIEEPSPFLEQILISEANRTSIHPEKSSVPITVKESSSQEPSAYMKMILASEGWRKSEGPAKLLQEIISTYDIHGNIHAEVSYIIVAFVGDIFPWYRKKKLRLKFDQDHIRCSACDKWLWRNFFSKKQRKFKKVREGSSQCRECVQNNILKN